jgi:hypothetical protein
VNVTLTDWEFRICEMLATERHQSNRQGGVNDAQIGPQDSAMTDLVGICGEFAFCKALNVYPDLTISPRSGSVDARIGGMTIDVKTTVRESGRLLATLKKAARACDVYVLAIGQTLDYRLAGWAFSDELIDEINMMNLGYGWVYALDQSQLHPIAELIEASRTFA